MGKARVRRGAWGAASALILLAGPAAASVPSTMKRIAAPLGFSVPVVSTTGCNAKSPSRIVPWARKLASS